MVKKQKDETPNINATPNRDIIQRLNFLYQASVYLQSLEPPIPISDTGKDKGKEPITDTHTSQHLSEKRKHNNLRRFRKQTTGDLARSYVQCMRVVGQKTTVKIDPAIKRALCSSCSTALIPGSSASVRVRKSSSHGHLVIYTCLHCKTSKVIPAPPTLPPSLGASTESRFEGSGTASTTAVHGTSESSDKPSSMADPQVQKEENKSRRRLPRPHLLPLFARPDVGHVVFRGNEVLDQQQGFGVCFI